jgi:hypothetical protein
LAASIAHEVAQDVANAAATRLLGRGGAAIGTVNDLLKQGACVEHGVSSLLAPQRLVREDGGQGQGSGAKIVFRAAA